MEEIETQKCYVCKEIKALDAFYKSKSRPKGVRADCKMCSKKLEQKYQQTETAKKYRQSYNKTEVAKNVARKYKINNKHKRMWKSAESRAKEKGIEFNIAIEDIIIPSHCPVLNIPLILNSRYLCDSSPTLDRIDVTKGYIKGNVLVISNRANRLKGDGSISEHLKIIEYMRLHGLNK